MMQKLRRPDGVEIAWGSAGEGPLVVLANQYFSRRDVFGRLLKDLASDHTALDEQDWLVPGAMVVVERASRSAEPTWPRGFSETRQKKYGETALWYVHAAPTS